VSDRTKVLPNPKHFQPFGCPTYVLATPLQAGNAYHKWKERSRVGIYIGPSPLHGRNVALVLDPSTGLVSPQHNVRFDSNFDTVKSLVSTSLWQEKAGFLSKRENETPALTPTGEPIRKRRKQVRLGDMPPSKKGRPASEGGRETEYEKRATTNETNQMHGRTDKERGDSPLGRENAPSQTLNDSPGLSPNVIEDELQLPEVQEPG
jgi:hypothetical protein